MAPSATECVEPALWCVLVGDVPTDKVKIEETGEFLGLLPSFSLEMFKPMARKPANSKKTIEVPMLTTANFKLVNLR